MRTVPPSDELLAVRINLVVFRAQRQFSQAELAKRARVSRTVISELEQGRGDVRLATLARIAKALETSVHQLLEPWRPGVITEEELIRRSQTPESEDVDARVFLAAMDEANGVRRYSRRGRRSKVARSA